MSTLKVNTLQDNNGNNPSTSEQIARGRAKAWVEFSGQGSASIIASFGVSGVNRTQNGNYTVSFDNDFPDTNYVVVCSSGANTNTYDDGLQNQDNIALVLNKTVGNVRIGCGDLDDGAEDDQDRVSVVIFN